MTHDKIEQIVADNASVEIDGVNFEINPLTVRDFLKSQVIAENQDEGQAILHMIHASLGEEGMSKQDIKEAPAKFMMAVQDKVEEVNDFEDFFDEDEKQEALKKLQ